MKKILILLTIFKATLPNACTDMCQNENNAFLRDRCYAQAYSAGAISSNDLASYLGRDIIEIDLNYNPSSIVSSLTGSNAASSNAYNFFLDPGYNMFMGNYGMGPTNGSYINSRNKACTPQEAPTLGSNPTINLGNNTTVCGTSSVFHPLLVGWAERNVIPNPLSFQTSSTQLFQAPLSLPPNTGNSALDPFFQYLVGDPNCPAAANCSSNGNTFTHFKGCRICDQFLNNGQPTINYRYCQFGFNWKYPLLGSISLLGYLAIIAADWGGNDCYSSWSTCQYGSWPWLSYMISSMNQLYAPTPIINGDLKLQWGKTGTNASWNFNTYSASFNGQSISAPCPTAVTSPYIASRFWQLGADTYGSCTSGSLNWNNFSIIQATGSNPYSSLT